MTQRAYFGAAAGIASTAALLVWFSAIHGPATTPDSLQYLFVAQDLLDGKSLSSLPRHWPPGYPLLIAVPLWWIDDPAAALRLLHTIIAFANVMLFAACIRPRLNAVGMAPLLATVALALAPGFILVSTMAWSESPFLMWLLLAFVALRRYSERGGRAVLCMAGLCLGGALLTRYVAVAFVGAAAVWVVAVGWRESRWRAVVLGAVLFAIASLPLALWLLLPAEAGHSGAPRSLVFHPVDLPRVIQGLSVVGEWFQSRALGVGVAVCVGLALVGMIVFALCSRTTPRAERTFVGLCVVSVGSYVAFLLTSISFFDFYTPLDLRILFPALTVFSVASGVAAGRISANGSVHLALVAVVLAVLLVSGLPTLSRDVAENIRQIPGYFNTGVRGLPVLAFARDLSGVAVYSNAPELLRLSGGMRHVTMLPAFQDMVRNQPAPGYQAQMVSLVKEIREGRAVVVYINAFAWRAYLPDASVFSEAQAGALVYEGGDGWVLAGEPARPQN